MGQPQGIDVAYPQGSTAGPARRDQPAARPL